MCAVRIVTKPVVVWAHELSCHYSSQFRGFHVPRGNLIATASAQVPRRERVRQRETVEVLHHDCRTFLR